MAHDNSGTLQERPISDFFKSLQVVEPGEPELDNITRAERGTTLQNVTTPTPVFIVGGRVTVRFASGAETQFVVKDFSEDELTLTPLPY